MNKIIAAFDGLKYSESCASYAIQLAKKTNAHLVGVFLEDFTYHSFKIYELIGEEGISQEKMKQFEERDDSRRNNSVDRFETACRQAALNHSVHHDRNIAIRELLHESIYADLLIIDKKETLTHWDEKPPTRFIRDLLASVECPVLVVPHKFRPIQKIIHLYDGNPSSVHAVKMFNYLFPEFMEVNTEVLSIKGSNETLHIPNSKLIREFMKRHNPNAEFRTLKGEAEELIPRSLQTEENALVVSGSYHRGMVSRWFRSSMADMLMKDFQLPLFIAHK